MLQIMNVTVCLTVSICTLSALMILYLYYIHLGCRPSYHRWFILDLLQPLSASSSTFSKCSF